MRSHLKKTFIVSVMGAVFAFYFWIISAATYVPLPTATSPLLLYSNQRHQDIKLLFSEALKKAHSSIYAVMYAVTDPQMLSLLNKKAHEGLQTTLLYDVNASPDLQQREKFAFAAFPVSSQGLMHRKILVIDEKQILWGSANMTTPSLTLHDNLVLGLYHPELAHFLKHPSDSPFHFTLPGQQGECWLLPDSHHRALDRLLHLIRKAKKSLHIAMFTLTHPTLIQELIAAYERGLDVSIAVDFYTGHGASRRGLEQLLSAHIPVRLSRGTELLHHKWALVDGSTLIAGSANWTKAAFEQNEDAFLILEGLNHQQKRWMKRLWQAIERDTEVHQNLSDE